MSGWSRCDSRTLILTALEGRRTSTQTSSCFVEAFDMLSEDFEEERFYVEVRRAYWAAPADRRGAELAEALISKLEF